MGKDVEGRVRDAEPVVCGAWRHTLARYLDPNNHVTTDASDGLGEIALCRSKVLVFRRMNGLPEFISLVHQHRCSARNAHKHF